MLRVECNFTSVNYTTVHFENRIFQNLFPACPLWSFRIITHWYSSRQRITHWYSSRKSFQQNTEFLLWPLFNFTNANLFFLEVISMHNIILQIEVHTKGIGINIWGLETNDVQFDTTCIITDYWCIFSPFPNKTHN